MSKPDDLSSSGPLTLRFAGVDDETTSEDEEDGDKKHNNKKTVTNSTVVVRNGDTNHLSVNHCYGNSKTKISSNN